MLLIGRVPVKFVPSMSVCLRFMAAPEFLFCCAPDDWVAEGQLEIGFIKRAIMKGDRWSGQVGFPGGKQEKGENDKVRLS